MKYSIDFAPRAYRQFSKLDPQTRARLAPAIDALRDDPRPDGCVKLTGAPDLYRVRVGTYRIVYTIEDDRLVVLVVKLGHRRDVYRRDG